MSDSAKWLLDTNVVSELRLPQRASPAVAAWFDRVNPTSCFISRVTIAEIRQGICSAAEPERTELAAWLGGGVMAWFAGRVLDPDDAVLVSWLTLIRREQKAGRTIPQPDSLIAATALAHGLVLVTRNVRDFGPAGVQVLNPWTLS